MNRNQRLEQSIKRLHQQQVDKQLTQIYAALAIAIFDMLPSATDEQRQECIQSIFQKSQDIWHEAVRTGVDVRQMCIERTGIDVMTNDSVR